MRWNVKYESGVDIGDGDEMKEFGLLYVPDCLRPTNGRASNETIDKYRDGNGYWVVDDTDKESMKLLALFSYAAGFEFGEDGSEDYGSVDKEEIVELLKKESILKTMEITDDEIDKFMEDFSIYDYFPKTGEYEGHDYWFNMKLVPADKRVPEIDEDFLTRLWK